MNKKEFLNKLKKALKALKMEEVQRHLNYYEELLEDMTDNGISEADAIAKIGMPEKIAKEILENAAAEDFRGKDMVGRVLTALSIILVIVACLRKAGVGPLAQIFRITNTGTSVSIIGGADGPTSIFIAGKVGEPIAFYAMTATVVTMTVIYRLYRKYKK